MSLIDEVEESWIEVGSFRATREAEQYALVLVASGVASRLVSSPAGIALFVAAPDEIKARSEIEAYILENRPQPTPGPTLRPLRDGLDATLFFCVVLVFIHAAATRGAFSQDWLNIGDAQARLIRSGEWWRAVTALGLHADVAHLLSNIVAGGLLALLLSQLLGSGLAWLAILLGGAIGNATVALLASADHAAIGASTSVFAALGLVAALAWGQQTILWRGLRRWRPLAAAVMLLALLGTGGEHVDIGAHIAGLLAGCIGGIGLYFVRAYLPLGRRAQLVFGSLAIAIFGGAWLAAFASA